MPSAVGLIADAYKAPTGGGGPPLTGLEIWLDASDAASFTYSSGALVSQWNDKSGNAAHAAQSTVSYQPTRESATINGLAAVKFPTGTALPSTCPANSKPLTFVAVVRTGSSVNGPNLNGKNSHLTGDGFFTTDTSSSKYRMLKYGVALICQNTTTITATTNMVIGITYSGTGVWTWYLNGVADGTGTNDQTFAAPTGMAIGASVGGAGGVTPGSSFTGHIGELVKYNTVLSGADLTTLHSYLMTKWGIASFTPTQIAGCVGWWDASDAASITSSGGAVSQWNDKSGNARHVTQATGANQPSTGVATINGLNVLTFDGTADRLEGPVTQLVNATTGYWSVFAVVKTATASGIRTVVSQDNTVSAGRIWALYNSNTNSQLIAFNTAVGAFTDAAATFASGDLILYSGVRGATTVELWKNTVSNGATTTTGTPTTAGAIAFRLGSSMQGGGTNFWQGDIAEVVIYNTALSTTDQQAVEAYLKTKWGTP